MGSMASGLQLGAPWAAATLLALLLWKRRRQHLAVVDGQQQRRPLAAVLRRCTPREAELSLAGRGLLSLPPELWSLDWLQRLDLSRNGLTAVPPEISALRCLLSLDLSHNAIERLPCEIAELELLSELNLASNKLASLPRELGRLRSLTKLSLASNLLWSLPPEIGGLQRLTDLNAANNSLTSLPPEIGQLRRLVYLNLMANALTHLPEELGNMMALYRLGLKSNRLAALPASIGRMRSLVELFITDNLLEALPPELGACTALVKLQASFNRLEALPAELAALPNLELMRVAVNRIAEVPDELAACPSLAWVSLGGNTACAHAPLPRAQIRTLSLGELPLGRKLGDGASGDVSAATLDGRDVAVKVFKGETSPDGQASDEVAVTCHVDHPNLTRVLAMVGERQALVLERVWGEPLALKPNLEVLLRCRWAPGAAFALATVAKIGRGVACALAYLHKHNICHGDVYAHNIVVDAAGHATLLDYGASFFYKPSTLPYEAQEVRAFGLFLKDLVERIDGSGEPAAVRRLAGIVDACLWGQPHKRPTFKVLAAGLAEVEQAIA